MDTLYVALIAAATSTILVLIREEFIHNRREKSVIKSQLIEITYYQYRVLREVVQNHLFVEGWSAKSKFGHANSETVMKQLVQYEKEERYYKNELMKNDAKLTSLMLSLKRSYLISSGLQDKLIKIREFTPRDHLEFPSYDKSMLRNEIESDIYQCWDQLEEKFLKALVEPVHNRLRRN